MPDERAATSHARTLVGVERQLAAAWITAYRRLRVTLQEPLLQGGPRLMRAQLPAATAETRQALQRALSRSLTATGQQSQAFAQVELERLAELLGPGARITPAAALASTEQARRLLLEAASARDLQWFDGVSGLLLAETVRLELASADPATAGELLLAPGIAQDGRASVWRSGLGSMALAATDAVFSTDNAGRGAIYLAAQPSGQRYQKQAIAAIDARTTDCCRRVNGQIQPLDKPFELRGTPRFADRLMQPPFHWNCRTVTVLYHPLMERVGPTTQEIRAR